MQEQNYAINIGAPQTQKLYNWQKDDLYCSGDWFVDGIYCNNCHTNLSWSHGLMHFCPTCGFMIKGAVNPNPPEGKNE